MTSPHKPPTSIEQQIALLRERGMDVNEAEAQQWLSTVGYYRLSGYWYTRRTLSDPPLSMGNPPRPVRTDTFAPGTRFTEITALYEFDRKLRTQVHDGIERVEIALRTSLADIISSTGSLALYDRDNFRVLRGRECEHYQIISTITSRVNRALGSRDSSHIKHNVEKYGVQLAPWVVMDVLDFSDLSKLFNLLRTPDQNEVAGRIGIDVRNLGLSREEAKGLSPNHPFAAALRQLTLLRNKSAHHARIWNCTLSPMGTGILSRVSGLESLSHLPLPPGQEGNPRQQSEKIYGALIIIAKILETVSPGSAWASRTASLVDSALSAVPFLTAQEMGFPDDWKHHRIWGLEES